MPLNSYFWYLGTALSILWMSCFVFTVVAIADFMKHILYRSWAIKVDAEISRLEQELAALDAEKPASQITP